MQPLTITARLSGFYFHYLIAIVSIAVLFLIPIYLWKAAKTV
ncbi:hypothetical protein P660_1406 [Acinetobacter baumannii UH20108]|nr:hypothetical protein P660_1406 [Acinetobacter baumannii UH20108]